MACLAGTALPTSADAGHLCEIKLFNMYYFHLQGISCWRKTFSIHIKADVKALLPLLPTLVSGETNQVSAGCDGLSLPK